MTVPNRFNESNQIEPASIEETLTRISCIYVWTSNRNHNDIKHYSFFAVFPWLIWIVNFASTCTRETWQDHNLVCASAYLIRPVGNPFVWIWRWWLQDRSDPGTPNRWSPCSQSVVIWCPYIHTERKRMPKTTIQMTGVWWLCFNVWRILAVAVALDRRVTYVATTVCDVRLAWIFTKKTTDVIGKTPCFLRLLHHHSCPTKIVVIGDRHHGGSLIVHAATYTDTDTHQESDRWRWSEVVDLHQAEHLHHVTLPGCNVD